MHRRSTVPRILTEQAESSTESEEEDDRVLDGKVVSPLYGQRYQLEYIKRDKKNKLPRQIIDRLSCSMYNGRLSLITFAFSQVIDTVHHKADED